MTHAFDDSVAYERFMGRWSHAAGAVFLEWLAPPARARWLDVGCGTGVFTELILDTCSPSAVSAVDPAHAQIDHTRGRALGTRARFQVADARALPFADATFDIVASALAINFIPDRPRALREMRRSVRAGGVVAGYVWDFAAERSPSWPVRRGLRTIGADVPPSAGTADSTLVSLHGLFEAAGFDAIATRSIDVTVTFPDFDAFWRVQMPGYSPIGKRVAAMSGTERSRLAEAVRAVLPISADGSIGLSARANAVKARAPN